MGPGAEIEGFEPAECVQNVLPAAYDAVVFHKYGIMPLSKGCRYIVGELTASGDCIGGIPHLTADRHGLGKDRGVRYAAGKAERNKGRRMGVNDRPQVRACPVHRPVKGKLRRRRVGTYPRPVRGGTYDLMPFQISLVEPSGSYPDVAVTVLDRDVPPGGCRHPVSVNPFHDHDDLVRRMDHVYVNCHNTHSFPVIDGDVNDPGRVDPGRANSACQYSSGARNFFSAL